MMVRSGVPVDASAVLPGWRRDASSACRGLSGKAGSGGRGFLAKSGGAGLEWNPVRYDGVSQMEGWNECAYGWLSLNI